MTRHSRPNKADRLISPGASKDEIIADFAAAPFDAVAYAMETKWGIDRLPGLVSPTLAAKFGAAMALMNDAITKPDPVMAASAAQNCIKGMGAMDAAAIAAGHQPISPDAWEFEVDGKICVLVRDVTEWRAVAAIRPDVKIYHLGELPNLIRHSAEAIARGDVKALHPAPIEPTTDTESYLNDKIQF